MVVKEVVAETAVEVIVEPQTVAAEDVFEDIFQNASRVDRFGIDGIRNCRVESKYDVKLGDIVSVEVALARREDSSSFRFSFKPYVFHIRDTSGDGVLGNDAEESWMRFELTRTISNPWNEINTGPYVVAVYRGRTPVLPGEEHAAIGDWISNWGGLVPGIYKASLVEDESITTLCIGLLNEIDVTNLIPDSVLIAWYVH